MKKHIVCFGDSNTHGYCGDPADCADGGNRYNEEERWTCRLQTALGKDYLVLEEGLSGRTTVFADPLRESADALGAASLLLMSHEPVDLLVIMLGTNDTKERFHANPPCIARGMERLVQKCGTVPCWGGRAPNILIVCPPPIGEGFHDECMGLDCPAKSAALAPLYAEVAERNGARFLDAAGCELNRVDHMHLSRRGHAQLAERLAALIG